MNTLVSLSETIYLVTWSIIGSNTPTRNPDEHASGKSYFQKKLASGQPIRVAHVFLRPDKVASNKVVITEVLVTQPMPQRYYICVLLLAAKCCWNYTCGRVKLDLRCSEPNPNLEDASDLLCDPSHNRIATSDEATARENFARQLFSLTPVIQHSFSHANWANCNRSIANR